MPLLAIAALAAGTYAFRLAGRCSGTGCASRTACSDCYPSPPPCC